MTAFLIYDLKVSILIAVCYMFYRLLMERETLHRLSRVVLLVSIVLSLVLPLCIITIHQTVWVEPLAEVPHASSEGGTAVLQPIEAHSGFAWGTVAVWLFIVGVMVRLLFLAVSYWRLHRLLQQGERLRLADGTRVVVVERPYAPFAWMNTVVMSRADYQVLDSSLLAHEQAHVRLRHSYDIVVVELLTALQWFNPVVWLLRQDLRTLHEYEADAAVLSQGFDESRYIHLLMHKATGIQACALVNGIGASQTKKRIKMMIKKKSPRLSWLRCLYVVPVAALSLVVTAKTVTDYRTLPGQQEEQVRMVYLAENNSDNIPASYLVSYPSSVKFYINGKLQHTDSLTSGNGHSEGRKLAFFVSKTTMQLNGQEFDSNSLPDLPVSLLAEIRLEHASGTQPVVNLVTVNNLSEYSTQPSQDKPFALHALVDQYGRITGFSHVGEPDSRQPITYPIGYIFIDGREATAEEAMNYKSYEIYEILVNPQGSEKWNYKDKHGILNFTSKKDMPADEEPIFDVVEVMPAYPGGEGSLMEFLMKNVKYPKVAMENGVQGRVLVQYIVEKDGSITNVSAKKVLDNNGGEITIVAFMPEMTEEQRQNAEKQNAGLQALMEEGVRVIKLMPNWTPGKQNGQVVRTRYNVPITFRLQ